MALNKDILGEALYTVRNLFDNKILEELLAIHGDMEGVRLAMAKADAEAIIAHIKTFGELIVPGIGLVSAASGGPVTGSSITGNII